MAKKKPSRDDIIDAAFRVIAENGWAGAALPAIAEEAGIDLADLAREFGLKTQILTALMDRVDRKVLAEAGPADAEESPRDRLFDVLMRRFDALEPQKPGLRQLRRDLPRDPFASLALAVRLRRSMAWMLAAAGIESDGCRGVLRVKALSALWLLAMRGWFADDSKDMSKTMAGLDKLLARAESLENSLPDSINPFRRRQRRTSSEPG